MIERKLGFWQIVNHCIDKSAQRRSVSAVYVCTSVS